MNELKPSVSTEAFHRQLEFTPFADLAPLCFVFSAVFDEWGDYPDEPQDESDLRAGRPGAGVSRHCEQVGHGERRGFAPSAQEGQL